MYIINKINELSETLILNENNKGNKLLNILLKIQLSPKQIIVFHRLNKLSFEYVINQIRIKFMEAIAHPSESDVPFSCTYMFLSRARSLSLFVCVCMCVRARPRACAC